MIYEGGDGMEQYIPYCLNEIFQLHSTSEKSRDFCVNKFIRLWDVIPKTPKSLSMFFRFLDSTPTKGFSTMVLDALRLQFEKDLLQDLPKSLFFITRHFQTPLQEIEKTSKVITTCKGMRIIQESCTTFHYCSSS